MKPFYDLEIWTYKGICWVYVHMKIEESSLLCLVLVSNTVRWIMSKEYMVSFGFLKKCLEKLRLNITLFENKIKLTYFYQVCTLHLMFLFQNLRTNLSIYLLF